MLNETFFCNFQTLWIIKCTIGCSIPSSLVFWNSFVHWMSLWNKKEVKSRRRKSLIFGSLEWKKLWLFCSARCTLTKDFSKQQKQSYQQQLNPIPTGDPSDEMFEVDFDAETEEILLLKPLLKSIPRLKKRAILKATVFENYIKSIIQHCERSELRLRYE